MAPKNGKYEVVFPVGLPGEGTSVLEISGEFNLAIALKQFDLSCCKIFWTFQEDIHTTLRNVAGSLPRNARACKMFIFRFQNQDAKTVGVHSYVTSIAHIHVGKSHETFARLSKVGRFSNERKYLISRS